MLLLQILIWVVGLCSAIYIAGYQMLFDGAVDFIMAIITMIKHGATLELSKIAVLGFIRICLASFVGWLIVLITSMLSYLVSEYKK